MSDSKLSRRGFLKASALASAGIMASPKLGSAQNATPKGKKPNFLYVVCDQQNFDAISAYGNTNVRTPNLDRLVKRGVSFMESYSTNPVCSPARSSLFTGRMPSETGVVTNDRPIHDSIPDMGQWLRRADYETVHCGKWHVPDGYPTTMKGFDVIPVGRAQGDLVDSMISRQCEAYLRNRKSENPFLLVASFMQPHDICYWAIKGSKIVPEHLRFENISDELPQLPPNHKSRPKAPHMLNVCSGYGAFTEEQWRYYLYVYYRQIEMMDADLGRILDALDDSGQADNTIVIFTSDHGEGAGRHMNVSKWYPYDEAAKVPMIVSCPGKIREDVRDHTSLVSGLDVMSTVCDFAGIAAPDGCKGASMKPLLEGKKVPWREFVPVETHVMGRTIRTAQYKYVKYKNDPVEQLFDMKADPWEMKNLYEDSTYSDVIKEHRKILASWESTLTRVKPTYCKYPNPKWIQDLLDGEYGVGVAK